MKTRKIIFNFPSFDLNSLNEVEKKIATSVQDGLDYINRFHYTKYQAIKNEYLALQIKMESEGTLSIQEQARLTKYLLFITDIKKREEFTVMLSDESQKARLNAALQRQWENIKINEIEKLKQQKANSDQIQQASKQIDQQLAANQQELSKLLTDFSSYGRFAHLTAEDLAIVAVMVDALIDGIVQSYNQTKNQTLLKLLNEKENALRKAKTEIQACMEKHKTIYHQNNIIKTEVTNLDLSDSLPSLMQSAVNVSEKEILKGNNDILFPLRQQINSLFGKQILDEHFTMWLDCSLTDNFPILPFEEKHTIQGNIYHYFNQYNTAKSSKSSYVGSFLNVVSSYTEWLGSYAKNFWHSGTEQLNKLAQATQQSIDFCSKKTIETYEFYFNPVAYHIKKYEQLETEIKEHQAQRYQAAKTFEQHLEENPLKENSLSNNIHDDETNLKKDWIMIEENPEKKEKLTNWQTAIKLFIKELQNENLSLKQSCFGSFFKNKQAIKQLKIAELQTLLAPGTQTLESLVTRAQLAKQKQLVISGWHSRTEELLDHIINDESPQKFIERYSVQYDEEASMMAAKYSRAVF